MSKRRGRAARGARRALAGQSALKANFKGKHAARRAQRAERKLDKKLEQPSGEGTSNSHAQKSGALPPKHAESGTLTRAPHSFIFHRGKVGRSVLRLVKDMRNVMEPFTATKLKALKRNNLKDFITNAQPVGVTHMVIFSRTEIAVTMRLIRLPHGPTLTFKVNEYSLSRDVLSSQKRPVVYQQQLNTQPLVVLNSFPPSDAHDMKHLQLTQSLFQNMFPSIKIDAVDLRSVRRCALLNYNAESDTIDFRHYGIKTVPSGVSKSLKKLIKSSKVPNLARYDDISQFLLELVSPAIFPFSTCTRHKLFSPGQLSDSDQETVAENLLAPQDLSSRGCKKGTQTNVRLSELGPRLTLELLKVEEGISDGEVMYHKYVHKTPEQVAALRKSLVKRKKLLEQRRKEQEANVLRKMQEREEQKRKCEEGLQRKIEQANMKQKGGAAKRSQGHGDHDDDDDGGDDPTTQKMRQPKRKRSRKK